MNLRTLLLVIATGLQLAFAALVISVLTSGLAGCASSSVWYQPGKTAQDVQIELARARLAYRGMPAPEPAPSATAVATVNVYNGTGSYTAPNLAPAGAAAGGGFGHAIAVSMDRNAFMRDWMIAHGYALVPANQVHLTEPVKLGNHTE